MRILISIGALIALAAVVLLILLINRKPKVPDKDLIPICEVTRKGIEENHIFTWWKNKIDFLIYKVAFSIFAIIMIIYCIRWLHGDNDFFRFLYNLVFLVLCLWPRFHEGPHWLPMKACGGRPNKFKDAVKNRETYDTSGYTFCKLQYNIILMMPLAFWILMSILYYLLIGKSLLWLLIFVIAIISCADNDIFNLAELCKHKGDNEYSIIVKMIPYKEPVDNKFCEGFAVFRYQRVYTK